MATSTIPKTTGTTTTSNFTAYKVGTTQTHSAGAVIYNSKLKLVEFSLEALQTAAELSVGGTYSVGSLSTLKPKRSIYFDINRRDGGNAVGTVEISSTDGSVKMRPLVAIPSGVTLRAHATYFYQ